ncbi:YbaN family protein [Marinobacter fonticola]|uniref:YbaN family protein n=1 Tax=Marinobacter fonticola TaxID=2603215 RepID=UPI001D0DA633|nr:YbaN family protein [Marinobacter fonticola]
MQGEDTETMSPSLIGYRILTYTSLGLAIIGIVLPLLPTTPFVLLAAWSAGRSSPEFRRWLENHRTFGPIIDNWRTRRAVPLRAKWLACLMLMTSWGILFASGASTWLLAGLAIFFCGLLVFLFTRPSC